MVKTRLLTVISIACCSLVVYSQSRSSPTAASQRTVLDQYCVTCHNDKLKTANLSLEKLDLTTAGDHPELWEKVIRKLRAGVMPPPGMRRPPLAEYEGLRDWLEAEMDRKAAANPNPGSVVLHRLNRTEYANVIRDLARHRNRSGRLSAVRRRGERFRQRCRIVDDLTDAAGSLHDGSDANRAHGRWILEVADSGELHCARRHIAESAHRRTASQHSRRICWSRIPSRPTASTNSKFRISVSANTRPAKKSSSSSMASASNCSITSEWD